MRNWLLASTAAAGVLGILALAGPANATLAITVTDNGTPVSLTTSSPTAGVLNATGTDANFTSIGVSATGSPAVPAPALGTTTLNVHHTSAGTDTLIIDIMQTGIAGPANFSSQTEMTTNGLIGSPGPSTLSLFINGSAVPLDTHTFAASSAAQTFSFANTIPGVISSNEEQYSIAFSGTQAALDTISFVAAATAVPEPATLALLGGALLGFGVLRRRRA